MKYKIHSFIIYYKRLIQASDIINGALCPQKILTVQLQKKTKLLKYYLPYDFLFQNKTIGQNLTK